MISKFKDVLVNEELEPERTRDALKTLNEQVHHQVSQQGPSEWSKLTICALLTDRKLQT
jgi:hypothetical protein